MNKFACTALIVLVGASSIFAVPRAQAQVSIDVGVAPDCPYGYFDYAPYACSPYGYYGPEWFVGGVFIGAGPWFHGPAHFYGHVDNRFDVRRGFHGPLPNRGERPAAANRVDRIPHFKGSEMRDGRGHTGGGDHH